MISFEVVKKPCRPRESDKVVNVRGSATQAESKVKGIYADEKPTAEICAGVAYFPDSHAEGNVSRTACALEVVEVSARLDDDDAERMAGASYGVRGFCSASRDVSCPPRAFSDDPSPAFLVPISPSVLQDAFVPLPAVVHAPPFLSSVFVATPPASPC